ncbi:MAG: GNAT family N-acetyltransferase [Chloroflexota bacterium]
MKGQPAPPCLRRATPQIAAVASQLLYLTLGRLADYWMGVDNSQIARHVLFRLFRARQNLFSHQFAEYAHVSGQPAGLELSYPARAMKALEIRTVLRFLGVAGIAASVRMVVRSYPLQSITEAAPDEYFLAHIAVLPEFEGRGLGQQLLRRAEDQAREAGLPKITLMVDADNARAISLYSRAGFQITSTIALESLRRRFQYRGYHHMAKMLP